MSVLLDTNIVLYFLSGRLAEALPDAIVVATAPAHALTLLTNDERLVKKQIVDTRSLRLK